MNTETMTQKLREAVDTQARELLDERDLVREKLSAINETLSGYKEKGITLTQEIESMKAEMSASLKMGKKAKGELFDKRVSLSGELEVCRELVVELEGEILPEAQRELEQVEKNLVSKCTKIFIETGNALEIDLNKIIETEIEPILTSWSKIVWDIQKDLGVNATFRELKIRNREAKDHIAGYYR